MIGKKGHNFVMKYLENLTKTIFGIKFNELSHQKKKVIGSIVNKEPLPENINITFHETLLLGKK